MKLEGWPRTCRKTIYSTVRTCTGLYVLTQSARNLSISSWTEPGAAIDTLAPQCWSQFFLKIFQVGLGRFFVIALVTEVNFKQACVCVCAWTCYRLSSKIIILLLKREQFGCSTQFQSLVWVLTLGVVFGLRIGFCCLLFCFKMT